MAVRTEIIGGTTYWSGVPMPHVTPGTVKGTWILTRNYHYAAVLPDGRAFEIWIREGFTFDGASIPRALWRLCGTPMEAPRIAAALIHDWLYCAHVCDRALADEIFNFACKTVGMGAWRTGPEWLALRACGWAAWLGHDRNDEDFARAHGEFVLEGETMKGDMK